MSANRMGAVVLGVGSAGLVGFAIWCGEPFGTLFGFLAGAGMAIAIEVWRKDKAPRYQRPWS